MLHSRERFRYRGSPSHPTRAAETSITRGSTLQRQTRGRFLFAFVLRSMVGVEVIFTLYCTEEHFSDTVLP